MNLNQPSTDPVDAAIERGGKTAALLIEARDSLFPGMASLLLITGEEGLRACVAGVAEAVIYAKRHGPFDGGGS